MQFTCDVPQFVTPSETHELPTWWNPPLQLTSTHAPEVQTPVPLGNAVVQFTTGVPQAVFESASHAAPFA